MVCILIYRPVNYAWISRGESQLLKLGWSNKAALWLMALWLYGLVALRACTENQLNLQLDQEHSALTIATLSKEHPGDCPIS